MKQASAALIALLNSGEQFAMADLYTFTLQGGTVLRYSAATTAVIDVSTGRVFALGPRFERTLIDTVIGVQVDTLSVNIYPDTTDLIGATLFLQAAWTGQFDGCLLQVERAFFGAGGWGDTTPGTVVLFAGRVSDVDCSRTGIAMSCKSHLELLDIPMPRRLWQAQCNHVFGDAMCQFVRAGLAVYFLAGAGSTTTGITGAPVTATPFAAGTITAMIGANAGQARTIYGFNSGGSVTVKLAFLSPVSEGDQFQLLPGCDRSLATCTNVFNNAVHFGGMPFIPTPEQAV
jgi:uncharacterized phage protein (TIGR02218 family)